MNREGPISRRARSHQAAPSPPISTRRDRSREPGSTARTDELGSREVAIRSARVRLVGFAV